MCVQTLSDAATSDLCASFQAVAFQHVEDRLKHALNYVDDHQLAVTSLVVVGGVAANKELRRYRSSNAVTILSMILTINDCFDAIFL